MPQIRDVLTHVWVEVAVRRRICHRNRNEHGIEAGESCLVIKDAAGGKKNYCTECAPAILNLASERVAELEAELGI